MLPLYYESDVQNACLFVLVGQDKVEELTLEVGTGYLHLDDNATYWGNQVMKLEPSKGPEQVERCYGIACCEKYILVSEYGKNGADAELVLFKRR